MSPRSCLWSAALVLAAAGPVAAQPPEKPSPLELVRGIREAGMADLAMEYLKEIENSPALTPADKAALILERAKCLLETAEDEPDEGTRTSMVNEAKEGFNTFLASNASHPRASEAALSIARLTSIEAKAQLNRARRMDIPPEPGPEKENALAKQRAEAVKARPLFLLASKRFGEAAAQIKTKLEDKTLSVATRQALSREAFDADLAGALNQYYLADTFLASDAKETLERDKFLEQAREGFDKLAKGSVSSRTVWIARAWKAEVLGDQGKPTDMNDEFRQILIAAAPESEDGKRMVRFFQVRRNYFAALVDQNLAKVKASEVELRQWLLKYGTMRKPTPEVLSARFYLAFNLQVQAETAIAATLPKKPDPEKPPPPIPAGARAQLADAEKLYRGLTQTDNDYTARANRNRMVVVRKLLGEADKPAGEYTTFETAQMAGLIQMAKMSDAERAWKDIQDEAPPADLGFWGQAAFRAKKGRTELDVKERKYRVIALLERSRELATDKDPPGDVIDTLLRLIYFYQTNDQPYHAAVLGEHVARTVRATGGKSAVAGFMALNGYLLASGRIKADATTDEGQAALAAARKADRERAIRVARFLDEKFPNDTPTDAARHRLALLLLDENQYAQAFDVVTKVRPGYAQLMSVRQLEGYIAARLIGGKPEEVGPLPAGGRQAVYRKAVADLAKVTKPSPNSLEPEVRGYLTVRVRLAQLLLGQGRADEEAEKAGPPGYDRALAVADEVVGVVPTFDCLIDKDKKGLNLDGMEMTYQGLDIRARALFVRARALLDDGKLDEAAAALDPAIDDVTKVGALVTEQLKKWAGAEGDPGDDEETKAQKAKVAGLAAGVDKTRREIIMLGFKLRLKQSKPTEATAMLDLLEKAGGSVEANQTTLEFMARELAAQIPPLRKAGKAAEAKALGEGLAVLLKKIAGIPNLPPTTTLFIGQTLHTVEQYDDALKEFAKIKPPSQADWATRKLEDYPPEIRNNLRNEIRDFRLANLYTARSLRGAKRLPEAEKLLTGVIGTPEKPGWASGSLDFRKELAYVYEAKGASQSTPQTANPEWAKALKEWTTLFQFAQARIKNAKDPTPEQDRANKNALYDAYLDIQRCLIEANIQLLKGNPKLAATFEQVGKKIADMENQHSFAALEKKSTPLITHEVWARYCDLIDKYPELKAGYKMAGGKFFMERPKD